jgi:hypothetical protein
MTDAAANIAQAKRLLAEPTPVAFNSARALGAASLAAAAALLMAGMVIAGPGVTIVEAPPTYGS